MIWRCVLVGVGDDRVFGTVRSAALGVVVCVPGGSAPGADADICFPVCEAADEGFEFGVVFDGTDAFDVAMVVREDGTLESIFDVRRCFVPSMAEVLHEQGISLAG